MPRKKLAWAELRVGILVLASFTILAITIVLIGGGASFFTPKYDLRTYLSSASGLKKGSLIWLAGIEAGNVHKVNITRSPDPKRAVEVIMRIDSSFRESIRENSIASLGSVGLLGDKYIDISRGSAEYKVIPPGGEVKSSAEADIKRIIQNSNDLVANLGDFVDKVNRITARIDEGQGTIGKFINDPSMFDKVNRTVSEAERLLIEVKSGEGSIGRLIADREFYDRLNGTLRRVDNIVAKVESGNGTLGKLVEDPAIFNRTDNLLSKLNIVAERIEKGEGFLGKLSKDEALYTQIRDTMTKFSSMADRINQGQGTIGKLFVDPSLYSNLNNASAELIKLLYDFRQNPQRFLRIKVGLF
jgi:phospholipid/cholesterol/gamma-HCH transport system substrate-binding protein